ncbi:hypothetical protein F4808DRAFT_44606 [Astrocystis sublimbata]|nr:hypothetical protein F4808DRAFT_44606 [Astrocystis sublimbata]
MTKVKKGRRQRAYRPRTQTGCLTCKIRRVKCDEALPACLRCTSTGRTCDGYAQDGPVESGSPGAVAILAGPSTGIQGCQRSRRSFAFFVQRTCSQLGGFFGSDFWERLVLQAAHHEPAIRHALVAIGSCHELAIHRRPRADAEGWFALKQYNVAIQHLLDPGTKKGKQSVDVYLILSILFSCFENLQGNNALAITHIQSGVKLLRETSYDRHTGTMCHAQFGSMNRANSYTSLEDYAKTFAFLDSQASGMIGDYQRPIVASSRLITEQLYGAAPLSFASIDDAKRTFEFGACLFSSTLDAKLSDDVVQLPRTPTKDSRCHLSSLMAKFLLAVQHLVRSGETVFTPKERLAAAVLQLNALVTWVSFEIELQCPSSSDTWDDFMDQLQEMVLLGEQIVSVITSSDDGSDNKVSFSWDSGYIISMYAVAINSRDPTIRRRAIAVLRSVHRQEGLWNSLLVARAAERVHEIEDSDLERKSVGTDSIEPGWLCSRPLLRIDGEGGRLHYTRVTNKDHFPQEVVEEVFRWC